ncbi:MAG TPA: hypothetical protein PLP20_07030, partial [Oscillospiraceae bacterium]|nr:hypothetical protein [Oscillospiraceae bacterium]
MRHSFLGGCSAIYSSSRRAANPTSSAQGRFRKNSAPRGVGTMISMLIVGRLVRIVDPRALVLTGLSLTALSLYEMTGFTPQMDSWPIIRSGVVQGLGLGLRGDDRLGGEQ